MADDSLALPFPGGRLKLVDLGDGTFALAVSSAGGGGSSEVEVTNWPALMTAQQGDNILAELEAQTALLQTIATNTTPP